MKKYITIGIIVLLLGVSIAVYYKYSSIEVNAFSVNNGNIQDVLESRGKVELSQVEKVYSEFPGIIQNVQVEESTPVEQDSELAQFDIQEMNLSMEKAQAAYEGARAKLNELKSGSKPEQIMQAQAELNQANAAIEFAAKDYENKKDKLDKFAALFEQGAISEVEFNDVQLGESASAKALDDAQQQYEIAKQNLDLLEKGASKNTIKAYEAEVEQARLLVEESNNNLAKAVIRSPMNGVVLNKFVENGMFVNPGTALFEIGDDNDSYIRMDIMVADAWKVDVGQKVFIYGDAVEGKRIEGEVTYKAPTADTSTSSLGVEQSKVMFKVWYDNSAVKLIPGTEIDVDIIVNEKDSVNYIPDKAVFKSNDKECVYVVNGGKVELKEIQVGIRNKNYAEVIDGLLVGDVVVDNPPNNLQSGDRVKITKEN